MAVSGCHFSWCHRHCHEECYSRRIILCPALRIPAPTMRTVIVWQLNRLMRPWAPLCLQTIALHRLFGAGCTLLPQPTQHQPPELLLAVLRQSPCTHAKLANRWEGHMAIPQWRRCSGTCLFWQDHALAFGWYGWYDIACRLVWLETLRDIFLRILRLPPQAYHKGQGMYVCLLLWGWYGTNIDVGSIVWLVFLGTVLLPQQ